MINYKKLAQESKASQDWFELWQLLELMAQLQPRRILEIGIDKGYLCQTFKLAFPDAVVVGLDDGPLEKVVAEADYEIYIQDSHEPGMADIIGSDHGPFDFIFIDGDHSYAGAMMDFELFRVHCRPGGMIGFHDIMRDPERVPHHAGVDCRQVFDELKVGRANIEIWNGHAGDNGPGIGVLFV